MSKFIRYLKDYQRFPSLGNAYKVWRFHRDSFLAQFVLCSVSWSEVYRAALYQVANARMIDLADCVACYEGRA